jgi:hypothetical protein
MRLVDIDDEKFWDVLFDEACVEGEQARRIENELNKIKAYDVDKVVTQLENRVEFCESFYTIDAPAYELVNAIEIVKRGGVNASD